MSRAPKHCHSFGKKWEIQYIWNCNTTYCPFKTVSKCRINESHFDSPYLDSVAHSQCACIPAKAAVTDQASLPDDMPSPCLHIHNTLGICGDSWGRQGESLSSLCWERYSNWPTDRDRLHNLHNTVSTRVLLQLKKSLITTSILHWAS